MKIAKTIFTAAILIFAVTMFSCKDDDGGGLGRLGVEDVKKLPNFEGTYASTYTDKSNLLHVLNSSYGYPFINMLRNANSTAYDAAFLKQYNKTLEEYLAGISGNKSGSVNVNIDDNEILKTAAGVTEASIKGYNNKSVSSSLTLGEILPFIMGGSSTAANPLKDKDWVSMSLSSKKTFLIKDFYTFNASGTWKTAGYVTVQNISSVKTTMLDSAKNQTEDSIRDLTRISVTLSVSWTNTSGTTKGAKFSISASSESKDKARYAENTNAFNNSDIVFYDNEGNKEIYRDALLAPTSPDTIYGWILNLANDLSD